jgi:TctA family transporter
MDLFQRIYYGFSVSLEPNNLFACFMGVFIGTLIGVLLGLGPVATIATKHIPGLNSLRFVKSWKPVKSFFSKR